MKNLKAATIPLDNFCTSNLGKIDPLSENSIAKHLITQGRWVDAITQVNGTHAGSNKANFPK